MEKMVISAWSSISALGFKNELVLEHALNNDCYLVEKEFNNHCYRVGSLSTEIEQDLGHFIQANPFVQKLDRSVQMALFSAKYLSSNLQHVATERLGVSIGSSRGATTFLEKSIIEHHLNHSSKTSLLTSPTTTSGNLASSVAHYIGSTGLVVDHSMTCSTAFQAITNGIAWIKAGFADAVVAGGAEAPLTPYTIAQLEALGIYSKDHHAKYPCRPLSIEENKKNTMTLGEGAALFVIEKKQESDIQSGDIIIEGIGFSNEITPSLTGMTENGDALQRSMKMACRGHIVDMVITHTPGTIKGDKAEINAIKSVFADQMPLLYANKWKLGHTYGASAAFSLISAIAALKSKTQLCMPYAAFGLKENALIPKKILINSAGFGGNASSVLLSVKH